MKILFIGDVFGTQGRKAIKQELPQLIKQHQIDFVIANAENTTHGRSLCVKHYEELQKAGVNFFTFGNHTWQLEDIKEILKHDNAIRPANLKPNAPQLQYGGVGSKEVKVNGKIIKITNLLGMSIPMGDIQENPFDILDKIIKDANKHDIHLVDFHCETTSEKNALFLKFAGKVSAILGTHTHVQTADEKIFNHTAYITDVGMTGASLGVIGADAHEILPVFEGKKTKFILKPSTTSYQFSAVLLEFDKDNTVKTISRVLKYEQ